MGIDQNWTSHTCPEDESVCTVFHAVVAGFKSTKQADLQKFALRGTNTT
jgi:hypothetical protein